jgi:hypothetical protein
MVLMLSILTVSPAVGGSAAEARPGLYTVAYLSDGRQQAFRSVEGAAWIQSRWQVPPSRAWTVWVDCPYPPTAAGVVELRSGIQDDITYFVVVTDDGVTWRQEKQTTHPDSGWTPFRQT